MDKLLKFTKPMLCFINSVIYDGEIKMVCCGMQFYLSESCQAFILLLLTNKADIDS